MKEYTPTDGKVAGNKPGEKRPATGIAHPDFHPRPYEPGRKKKGEARRKGKGAPGIWDEEANMGGGLREAPHSSLKAGRKTDSESGRKILFALFTVAILIGLAYLFIPTVDANVRLLYFEGAAGAINVDSKLKNDGNTALVDFELRIIVVDSQDKVIRNVTHTLGRAEGRTSYSFDNIYFKGDHYETYHIIIDIEFKAGGESYSAQYSHETDEYMRITYEHSVP